MRKMDKELEPERSPSRKKERKEFMCPKRYVLAVMLFLGFAVLNCVRSSLSVAIVAMVTDQQVTDSQGRKRTLEAEFNWSPKLQGVILGSFFYGYICLQIPGGWLSTKFGGKRLFGMAIFLASLLALITPFVVRWNVYVFIALRVTQGLVLGVVLPCNHALWSKWAPVYERSILVSISLSGLSAGMIIALPVTGFLAKYGLNGGWPTVFYVFGGCGVVWSVAWFILVHESPDTHPFISDREKNYILEGCRCIVKSCTIPWKSLINSPPVWVIVVAQFTFDWQYYTLLICLPMFFSDVLRFDIAQNGIASALPWLTLSIATPLTGLMADFIRCRNYCDTTLVRKVFYSIGIGFPSMFCVSSTFLPSPSAAVAFMCAAVGLCGFVFSSLLVNPLDIAPKYAGIIISISNTVGTIPGFLSPIVVGIVAGDKTADEWRSVFLVSSCVCGLGFLVYGIWGTGNILPWACAVPEKDVTENNKYE